MVTSQMMDRGCHGDVVMSHWLSMVLDPCIPGWSAIQRERLSLRSCNCAGNLGQMTMTKMSQLMIGQRLKMRPPWHTKDMFVPRDLFV